jgi:nucleotide-binding universal stress UspA family protein
MTMRVPQRILVATDFSEGSDEALDSAVELARRSDAAIEIVHVVEVAQELPFVATYFDSDYGVFYANVDQHLTRRAARVAAAGVTCTTKIVEGSAALEITRRAREMEADLIVVGTHGRTGLAHVVLGSVAEQVVRRASCPVLTVPFSKKQAAA